MKDTSKDTENSANKTIPSVTTLDTVIGTDSDKTEVQEAYEKLKAAIAEKAVKATALDNAYFASQKARTGGIRNADYSSYEINYNQAKREYEAAKINERNAYKAYLIVADYANNLEINVAKNVPNAPKPLIEYNATIDTTDKVSAINVHTTDTTAEVAAINVNAAYSAFEAAKAATIEAAKVYEAAKAYEAKLYEAYEVAAYEASRKSSAPKIIV
jgi:hypothetical protein